VLAASASKQSSRIAERHGERTISLAWFHLELLRVEGSRYVVMLVEMSSCLCDLFLGLLLVLLPITAPASKSNSTSGTPVGLHSERNGVLEILECIFVLGIARTSHYSMNWVQYTGEYSSYSTVLLWYKVAVAIQ
jgi:hypothetical protein